MKLEDKDWFVLEDKDWFELSLSIENAWSDFENAWSDFEVLDW
jgi:hypothetical protein